MVHIADQTLHSGEGAEYNLSKNGKNAIVSAIIRNVEEPMIAKA
jgi:hypothetical protein